VRVTVDGRGLVRSITIDPEAFEGRDAGCCRTVLAAVAEAQRRAADMAQAAIRSVQPSSPVVPL
jgi:DNA-binding protein YbaB